MARRGKRTRRKGTPSHSKAAKPRKPQQPDEVFQHGPIQVARFGNLVLVQNNMDSVQHAEFMTKLADQFIEICQRITALVKAASEIVQSVDPLDLLRQGYWRTFAAHVELGPEESNIQAEQVISKEMINYVLKLVASVGSDEITESASEEQMDALQETIGQIYHIFKSEFILARTAYRQRNGKYDPEIESFSTSAEMEWMFAQGDRHQYHDPIHIPSLLQSQYSLLQEIWGISVEDIARGIRAIQHSLSKGFGDAMSHLGEQHDKFIRLSEANPEMSVDEVVNILTQSGTTAADEDAFSRVFEFGLFDVTSLTNWPASFIDDLSIAPGQDHEFIEHEQRGGWPNQPTMCHEYPFIQIRGKSYVFNQHLCMNILYRSIQRALLNRKPSLNERWNQRQKSASETLALGLIARVLPQSQLYQSVHYEYTDESTGETIWAECDGLIVIDNHLIVIEVKAGASTTKPPYVHYKSHINSLRKLIRDPVVQGRRIIDALSGSNRLTIHDKHQKPIATLLNKFDSTAIVCVTLDQLTNISPQVEHLRVVDVDTEKHPVWPISIDDLRVVTDIFSSPVQFMHFLQERNKAFSSASVQIRDELDHVGAYLFHNHYSKYAEGFPDQMVQGWGGYRDRIDQYYYDKFVGSDNPRHPIQDLPAELNEIIHVISSQQKPGYIAIGKKLLDGSADSRDSVCSFIVEMRHLQATQQRPRPVSALGEWPLTIFANTVNKFEVDFSYALVHACADLQIQGEAERVLLVLGYSSTNTLVDVDFELVTADTVIRVGEEAIRPVRQKLFQSRVRRSQQEKKTQRRAPRN